MTTDTDPRNFIKALSLPVVRPFISWEKVIKSEQFLSSIQYYDDHFDRHRDTGPFERLLALLDDTKYRDLLANYLRVRHSVQVSRENGKVKVSVLKSASVVANTHKEMTFAKFSSDSKPAYKDRVSKIQNSEKNNFKKNYVDALDHPARLPGSFGHGRRK